jgi:hypothetical protein
VAIPPASLAVAVGCASTCATRVSGAAVGVRDGAFVVPAVVARGVAFAVCAGAVEGWARRIRSVGRKPGGIGATVGAVFPSRSASDGRRAIGGRVAYIAVSGVGEIWGVTVGC